MTLGLITQAVRGLRHYDYAPQLPTGYAGMYVLALIPPLWFRVMNPRVRAYYQGDGWQLSAKEFEQSVSTDDSPQIV
ncbi:hypothetical protein KFJ24_10565 [Marinobacter sediminum]|nr:hypothetical protein [Marinobacter sediminum]